MKAADILRERADAAAYDGRLRTTAEALHKYDDATRFLLGGEPIDTLMIAARDYARAILAQLEKEGLA